MRGLAEASRYHTPSFDPQPTMASRIDPSVAQLFAQNVGAKPLAREDAAPAARASTHRLEPALVQKITQNVAMFAHMDVEQVQLVLARGEMQRHAAGAQVFAEGDMGQTCHVVLKGVVEVRRQQGGESQRLAALGPGECFGEMALVRDEVRTASVVAQGDCVTLRLDRSAIDAHTACAAAIYRNIAAILAQRLQQQTAQHSGPPATPPGNP